MAPMKGRARPEAVKALCHCDMFVPVNICDSGVAINREEIASIDPDEGEEMEVECEAEAEAEAEADKEAGTQGGKLALLSTVTHNGH